MTISSSIGQYRLESSLGEGRFTETYHAYDLVRRRPVALKLLQPGLLATDQASWDFLETVQRAAELVHPRIAWVWEIGEADGRFYLTERFVSGESLAAHLKRSGPLHWDKAMQVLEQIAQGIEYAEERGWTHGRVTTHNILLGADLGAVLTDYGLVNAVIQKLPDAPISLYEAQYLPPEILKGQPVTPRTDQYSLACTLVEMFTGANPFAAPSLEEVLARKTAPLKQPVLPLESLPMQATEVVEHALHPDPAARFDNALAFVTFLERAVRHGLTDASARLQHEEQIRLWRESEQQARLQAEEAARQAAVEQARREIQERARLEAEQVVNLQADELRPIEPPSADASAVQPRPAGSHRRPAARPTRRTNNVRGKYWPIYAGIIVAALALGGYWLGNRNSTGSSTSPSATPSSAALAAATTTALPPSETPAPSSTLTRTATARPTVTPTRTRPPTQTATFTPSPTPTDTPIRITPTRERPSPDD